MSGVLGERNWQGCRSLARPLTVMGCERRVFILTATFAAAAFNALNSLPAGLLIFAVGYAVGWFGTRSDPHMLPVAKAAAAAKVRYDPAKRPPSMEEVEIITVVEAEQ